MKHSILIYSLMLLAPALPVSYAQYGDMAPDGEETQQEQGNQSPQGGSAPVIIRQQPYEYYYWPEENLDSFGLSTLGQGQGGSTLGKSLNRKSNLEANSPKKPDPDENAENGTNSQSETDTELYPPEEPDLSNEAVTGEPLPTVPSESQFYEWVDDQGNVHITNKIGDVPPDQLKEIYNPKSAPGEE